MCCSDGNRKMEILTSCKQSLVIILQIYSQHLYDAPRFRNVLKWLVWEDLSDCNNQGRNSPWYLTCFVHHITLFSLYEFCLVMVFSSKVFNEIISIKLYASSLTFPHRGFYVWWLQAYFLLEFNMSFTHNPKDIVYSLFFSQGFWGDDILKDRLQIIKWTWID